MRCDGRHTRAPLWPASPRHVLGDVLSLGAAIAIASYLLWARRVVASEPYVAVRGLGRHHVALVDHVRHLELRPTSTGGVLCVHTGDGRCMRLRRVELTRPELAAALRTLAGGGEGTHDARVRDLLDLPAEDARLRARYLPEAR